MQYDSTLHQWQLELSDAEELFGDISKRYGSIDKATRELKKQARTVYRWLYAHIPTWNKDFVEYAIAKDSHFQAVFKEALLAQLEYDLETGGNSVGKQIGIDFLGGGSMNRQRIEQSQVGIEVQQILANASGDFTLMYQGDFGVRMSTDRYTEYGY